MVLRSVAAFLSRFSDGAETLLGDGLAGISLGTRQDIVTIFVVLAGDFDIDNMRPNVADEVTLSQTKAILKKMGFR